MIGSQTGVMISTSVLYSDFAVCSKLEGVAHQIQEHLPQAARIPSDRSRNIGRQERHEFQTLLLPRARQ